MLIFSLVLPPALIAQVYSWTDENGVTHFSHLPPEEGQEVTVHELPASEPQYGDDFASGAGADDDGTEPRDEDQAAAPEDVSYADQKRLELAESREQERREQAELAAECAAKRERLAGLEPSRRVFYTNEDGETVRMDDVERVSKVEELRSYIESNCP